MIIKNQRWFLFLGVTLIFSIFTVGIFLPTDFSLAHPGNLDYRSCHICYTNCSYWNLLPEQYHCHTEGYYYDGSCESILDRPVAMSAIEGEYKQCLYQHEKNFYKQYSTPVPTPTPISTPRPTPFDADASCKSQFGYYSISSPNQTGYCTCISGYRFDINKQCVFVTVPTPTPTPLQTPVPTPTPRPTPPPTPILTPTSISTPKPTTIPTRTSTPTKTPTPTPINKSKQQDKTVVNTATESYNEATPKVSIIARIFKFFFNLFK